MADYLVLDNPLVCCSIGKMISLTLSIPYLTTVFCVLLRPRDLSSTSFGISIAIVLVRLIFKQLFSVLNFLQQVALSQFFALTTNKYKVRSLYLNNVMTSREKLLLLSTPYFTLNKKLYKHFLICPIHASESTIGLYCP